MQSINFSVGVLFGRKVWQPGCTETRTVQVYVPAQGAPPVVYQPRRETGFRLGVDFGRGFRINVGAHGR